VPAVNVTSGIVGMAKDFLYLSFNVQMVKDEYLLSHPVFQIEFADTMLFMAPRGPRTQLSPEYRHP
jgi:hypothetical protein